MLQLTNNEVKIVMNEPFRFQGAKETGKKKSSWFPAAKIWIKLYLLYPFVSALHGLTYIFFSAMILFDFFMYKMKNMVVALTNGNTWQVMTRETMMTLIYVTFSAHSIYNRHPSATAPKRRHTGSVLVDVNPKILSLIRIHTTYIYLIVRSNKNS